MMYTVSVPTDAQGNGWVETQVPWSTFESATAGGNYPPVDGYSTGTVRVQDRDGNVLVELTGSKPGIVALVFVTATA